MAASIISGKEIAGRVYDDLARDLAELRSRGVNPGLAVVLVGEDPASQVYVGQKEKKCQELGILSKKILRPDTISEGELLALVDELNADDEVHGVLVQLPLPAHIDETKVMAAVSPEKDVDGTHPMNLGRLMMGMGLLWPCTPAGVIEMLKRSGVEISGKNAVVVGRSNTVGKPCALMLMHENATVTVCHSKTADLAGVCRRADILVAAVGRAKMITGDMVAEGATVIDVGINRGEDGKLVGDVDFEAVSAKASGISPVPGGVGVMTIAMLMKNTVRAAQAAAG
ncbi:MAG: bifunctional methylenetetrahydrofolate dehydrogenase/methenyltetrahydrofolate cyclohydrolase FolD [Actinobacteria bacterium]|nr:MAG: bifunctional methylenetetrahydrofolate dehydrogenase/methenyltetrahydrofolate cyclohydrolase FolD [Actinomycetota bacterium]